MNVYRFIENSPSPEAPLDSLSIAEGEWKQTLGGVLYTQKASSCTVVAAFDSTTRTGLLGHFEMGTSGYARPEFDSFINQVEAMDVASTTQAWVSGATELNLPNKALESLEMSEEDQAFHNHLQEDGKNHTIAQLARIGITQVRKDWLVANQKITSLIFNTADGGAIGYQVQSIDPQSNQR